MKEEGSRDKEEVLLELSVANVSVKEVSNRESLEEEVLGESSVWCAGDSSDISNISTCNVSLEAEKWTRQSAVKGCLDPFFFRGSGDFIGWLQNSGHVLSRRGVGIGGLRKLRTEFIEDWTGGLKEVEEDPFVVIKDSLE